MIETVSVKASPYPTGFLWFFRNGDSWSAPEINNGLPYLPDRPQWWRNLCWAARNPAGNLMGFVLGCEGFDYTVTGPAPVMLTTLYDDTPPRFGWKWSIIKCGWFYLPFVSYSGTAVLWYLGWRPYSGGLGFKFNLH